jgi:chromosomal replication initiation ATPase DnaA
MNAPVLERLSEDAAEKAGHLAAIAELRAQLNRLEAAVLADMARPGTALFPRVWIDRLAELVAFEFGIDVTELRGSYLNQRFTRQRFVWVWLIKEITQGSYPRVAELTGYIEHSAVRHACQRVQGWRVSMPDFKLVTDQLLQIGRALRTPSTAPAGPEAEPGQ